MKTWAEKTMEKLEAKGRDKWTEDDWEAYHYIQQLYFESGYYED